MKKNYFLVASIALLLLSFIAFSDNLITDIGQESNSDPKFIIHGLFMFAWFTIFVVQSNFIRIGDYKAHRIWGIAGMIAAIGVIISTFYIFVIIYEGWDALPFYAKANRFFLPSYALLVGLGYLNRANAVKHKRMFYLATIYMLGPILDRASAHLHIDVFIFNPLIWNSLFISLFIYDWVTLKKIHKISYLGFIWFYIVWALSILT
jgi:hypothetical protein